MKRFIPILGLAASMVACTSNPNTTAATNAVPQVQQAPAYSPDTAGLAQFQQWKAANELAAVNEYQKPVANYTSPVKTTRRVSAAPVPRTTGSTAGSGSTVSSTNDQGTMSSETSNTAKAPAKKGWSKAAKGTAIGAGAGAAAGAVINKKNRVVGGVIGGVVGGAVGYGIGRHMDKQDGRY
jgi:hypothetical protein